MAPPEVVIFDVNETLSDLRPLAERIADVGGPAHLLDVWFASVLRDGIALAVAGEFADFKTLAIADLEVHLRSAGVTGDLASAAEHVVAGFDELPVHPDVGDGLRALHDAGCRLLTLTNGSVAVTEAILERAGLLGLVEHRLDVSAVRRWKPHPAPYRHALETAAVPAGAAALVAVHPWDVVGAQAAGIAGAWLNRSGSPWPFAEWPPALEAPSLPELAGSLLG